MRRYSKQKQIEREEILKRFYGFSQGHAVYAIVHRNIHGKIPIYVGESKNPKKRFKQHLAVMFGGREGQGPLARKLQKILRKSEIIEFHHLENVKNIAQALAKEASWAQALKKSGFELANTWAEHHSNVKFISKKRLMSRMRLSEVEYLDVHVVLDCPKCHTDITITKTDLVKSDIRDITILELDRTIVCEMCQCQMNLDIDCHPKLEQLLKIDPFTCDVEGFKLALGIL